jgi:four helix bundle protein
MEVKIFDLEERLIEFSSEVIFITEKPTSSKSAAHMAGQLMRSATSSSLNYGEAKSAESKKDFVHKMQICLKELRESHICLKIIFRTKSYEAEEKIKSLITECNELISIFVKSIDTASKSGNTYKGK